MEEQITQALIAAGKADKGAEQFLENLLKENYASLIQFLGKEVANEAKPFESRQMACLYIKNTLAAQSPSVQREKHERWKGVSTEIRAEVKENMMTALRSAAQPQLPHFVAVASAEIAVVELPFREWPTLVGTLMENVTSSGAVEVIKIASLQCLGYISDRLVDVEDLIGNIPELDTSIVDSMLTTIVDAVQPNKPAEMRFFALQALKNSLLFIRKNMDTKNERDVIMSAICEACKNEQAKVRNLAFQCLDTICECYYEHLQDYMTSIYQLTTGSIKDDTDEDTKMSAIEVWNTVCEMESSLLMEEKEAAEIGVPIASRPPCPRYVQAAMEHLVPLLLALLTLQNEDDEDDTQTLQESGANCLELISQTVEGLVVPHVIGYVQQNIQSNEWRLRDAAIVAFMAILDGPSTADIGQYVTQSLQVMLSSFNDQHPVVRGSAVHCVRKMCAHHLECLQQDMLSSILTEVDKKLKDRPSICAPACSTIFEIAEALKTTEPPPTNVLSGGMIQLMQDLLAVTDRPDSAEHNIRVVAMSAACSLITASAMDVNEIFGQLLPAISGRLEGALNLQTVSNDDKEFKAQMIGQLCALIQTLYQRMNRETVLHETDRVMNLLLQSLSVRNAAEEGFMAISSVASNLEDDFEKYLEAYIPFLLQGLNSLELTNLCIICTGGVVDLCSLGPKIQPYCDKIMEVMFNIIRDGTVHRDVKPIVISCFGDVAMAIGAGYQPYLQLTMMLLMQAAQQQAPADNEDMVTFINKLRCAVLEAYSGILVGLAEGNAIAGFASHLTEVMQFLGYLSTDPTKDAEVLAKSVTLLGDIAHEMGIIPEVKAQLNQAFTMQLVREGLASDDKEGAEWTRAMIEQALKA